MRSRFLLMVTVSATFLVSSCALFRGAEPVAEDDGAMTLEQEDRSALPPPGPIPSDAHDLKLLPEDLEGKLGFHEFDVTDTSVQTSISVVLENLQANQSITIELSARFVDAQGNAVFETTWDRVTIKPHRKHHYFAETLDVNAVDGKILLRVVEKNN